MEGMSQLSSFAYIMMQDRLSTGGSFILCDGNARGFPISYASPGFVGLFGYPAAECVGVKCGLLVAGPSIVSNDKDLTQTAKCYGITPANTTAAIDLMTQYTGEECRLIMQQPSEKVSFSLVLNRHKKGELFVCELTMMLHRHPVLGWSYFVGLQRDISQDISVKGLLLASASKDAYLQLIKERETQVLAHVSALGMKTGNAAQYLHEKASEAWRTLMVSDLPDAKKLSELPSTLCSSTAAGSVESESTETGSTSEAKSIRSVGTPFPALLGTWKGQVSPTLGGYEQTFHFLPDSVVRVTVHDKTATGRYYVNGKKDPKQLILRLPGHVANAPVPPPIVCIMRIVDGESLHLCLPWPSTEAPKDFEGPGYCVMSFVCPLDASYTSSNASTLKGAKSGWMKQTSGGSTILPESEDMARGVTGSSCASTTSGKPKSIKSEGESKRLLAAALGGAALAAGATLLLRAR